MPSFSLSPGRQVNTVGRIGSPILMWVLECHWTSCFMSDIATCHSITSKLACTQLVIFFTLYAETILDVVWWPYGCALQELCKLCPEVLCLAINFSVMWTCCGMPCDYYVLCLQSWCVVCTTCLIRLVWLSVQFQQPSIDFRSLVVNVLVTRTVIVAFQWLHSQVAADSLT
jgi:hypothetical protein